MSALRGGEALAKISSEKMIELEQTMAKELFDIEIVDIICLLDG